MEFGNLYFSDDWRIIIFLNWSLYLAHSEKCQIRAAKFMTAVLSFGSRRIDVRYFQNFDRSLRIPHCSYNYINFSLVEVIFLI